MTGILSAIDVVETASIALEMSSQTSSEINADADDEIATTEHAETVSESDNAALGTSLISSSRGTSVRNYEIYNRMEGCSSDEETQTDNDDDNNESEVEELPHHHYAVLNDDMFEFGEFTTASQYSVEDIADSNYENEWQESVTGLSVDNITPAALGRGDSNLPAFSPNFDKAFEPEEMQPVDTGAVSTPEVVDQRGFSTGELGHTTPVAYVSIPPLSAGIRIVGVILSSCICDG